MEHAEESPVSSVQVVHLATVAQCMDGVEVPPIIVGRTAKQLSGLAHSQ